MSNSNQTQVVRIRYEAKNSIPDMLRQLDIDSIARKSKVVIRKARKCDVVNLLIGYFAMISNSGFSYDDWAKSLGGLIRSTISGQAVCKRLSRPLPPF